MLKLSDGQDSYAELFREFADAFKGKKQLHWSNGLKKLLAVEQKTDAEIVSDTEQKADLVRELTMQLWQLILFYDARVKVLELVELDYLDHGNRLDDYIINLAKRYISDYLTS